jgi:hypothetical protein
MHERQPRSSEFDRARKRDAVSLVSSQRMICWLHLNQRPQIAIAWDDQAA